MRVEERFLKYISVWTTSDEESKTVPSTDRQLNLAHILLEEMKEMGLSDTMIDENGYVYGSLPASEGYENIPPLGFLAHMDTAPDYSGQNVKLQIIDNYDGKDIVLGQSGKKIMVSDFPHLSGWKGRKVITTDGTTLLGADDKAGIAEIMTLAQDLVDSQDPHGKICFGFTVDEEIGSGAQLFDLDRFGAKYAFTVDGDVEGEIQYENFNAASAIIEVEGNNVHPGSAKDIMINAQEVAMEFHSLLPKQDKPEHTEGYQGFNHLCSIEGSVEHAKMEYIIRDFDMESFKERKKLMDEITEKLNEKYGNCVALNLKDSYFNMKEKIEPCMWIIDSAIAACEKAEVKPKVEPIRGGTDGSQLSFRGLPCPNLGTGGSAFHGPYEHISVEGMESTVNILKNIVREFVTRNN